MSPTGSPLLAAAASAAEELAHHAGRYEVFARSGESFRLRVDAGGERERWHVREVGVACRVWSEGGLGFAASSGSSARIGREVALAALAGRVPATNPLPPRAVLGETEAPEPSALASPTEVESFAQALLDGLTGRAPELRPVDLRAVVGRSDTCLLTGEGFLGRARAAGTVVELLVAPPDGPWRLFRWAARQLADLDHDRLSERASEITLLATRGAAPERRLADVVLAPAVAAPLVVALVEWLITTRERDGRAPRVRVSPAWYLADRRSGPDGLLPLPFDGEGLPARTIVLLAGGHLREPLVTWAQADGADALAGGAVRPSYRQPPYAGPANLVVEPRNAHAQKDLLHRLAGGFYLALPVGGVEVDRESGRFVVRAAAVAIEHGRPLATHPLLELRGSFRRLLSGLEATGADSESFSLTAAVTTPSLLLRQLEVA
jgi:predicted Zn-dependent protease